MGICYKTFTAVVNTTAQQASAFITLCILIQGGLTEGEGSVQLTCLSKLV
jgi:hypothetical protein